MVLRRILLAAVLAQLALPARADTFLAGSGVALETAKAAFDTTVNGHELHAEAAPASRGARNLNLAAAEFGRYPLGCVLAAGLRRVVVCGRLTVDGAVYQGSFDAGRGELFFAAQDLRRDRHYARVVMHHEFFHLLDKRQRGSIFEDPAWDALVPRFFDYGDGGRFAQWDRGGAELSTGSPGFVTRYARTGLEEDKAETFAHLMVDLEDVLERTATDAVLAAKVKLLARQLARFGGDQLWNG
jgi:hypothetical protein